jgi:DNA-directed RNA polymerase specialized sigma24 family protein
VQEDRIWLEQVQQGEAEGLRRIYERYKDDLLTVAAGLLTDRASAEDCLHEVFVHLATHAADLRLHGSLKGYLITCVVNRARDLLRRNRRMEPASLAEIAEMPAASTPCAAQIAQELVLSINTVQSRYRYGLEKLRALLNAGAEL